MIFSIVIARALSASFIKSLLELVENNAAVSGDGANDVSMIQVADVGIGISGQEGMQV